MATRKIAFKVAYKQNKNTESQGYGKYYPEAYSDETLSLRGLVERVAFDQSVYSRDIIEGVIQRLTKVMVELLQGGQPVKWDGLGTFTPMVESAKGGVLKTQLLAGNVSVDDTVAGIHIRFIPENAKGDEITSRKFKDSCVLNCVGVVEVTSTTINGKKKSFRQLVPMETWIQNGGGATPASSGGSETPSGGGGSEPPAGGDDNVIPGEG